MIIAGVTSGCGKTTITTAIVAALRARGLRVKPFKAGPDYIDPSYHTMAAGVPSRNLDTWLVPPESLKELLARSTADADIAVIEGVMGLYDGRADGDEGSTAHLAKVLDTPVVLVLDVTRTSRTAAALTLGCQRFDPAVRLAGVILNGVASEHHLAWTAGPIEEATGLPVLGYLPRRAEFKFPERHLGLVPTTEGALGQDLVRELAKQATETIDLDRLVSIARAAGPLAQATSPGLFPRTPQPCRTRVALAMDEAFTFYYQDNLDLLQAWGAELVPFSPLHDHQLPEGVAGVYVGGGFPELYAAQLSANQSMLQSLREAVAAGMLIYAECGGLMYLCEGIVDFEGRHHPMAGIVPGWSVLDRPRLSIGYRVATAVRDSFLLKAGEQVRGHEFHWSQLREGPSLDYVAYELESSSPTRQTASLRRLEGYARENVLASYVHIHFGSDPRLARRFVNACAQRHTP